MKVSTAVLYALCILAAVARFYIRCFVQRSFAADDAFLIIALGSLTSLLGVMYATSIDNMYLVEFLTYMIPGTPPPLPLDTPQRGNDFQRYVNIILILSWITINAVKFSFLFLFRQLVDRVKPLVIYWRIVLVACVGAMVYGICAFFVACPNNYNFEACTRLAVFKKFWNITDVFSSNQMHERPRSNLDADAFLGVDVSRFAWRLCK